MSRSIGHIVGLERIVLDELRTYTAVKRVVYVLKEYSPESRANLDSELVGLEGEGSFLLGLESLKLEHLVGETLSEKPHSLGAKVELVARALATESRNYVCVGKYLRKVGHNGGVERRAHTTLLGILKFTGKKRSLLGVEIKILAQAVVDSLYALGP